jgi:hypothetical protein
MGAMRKATLQAWPWQWIGLALSLGALLSPAASLAEEGAGRPWGRLNKPALRAPEAENNSGYLGRYNPWRRQGGSDENEALRYREQQSGSPAFRSGGGSGYPRGWYPPAQPYAPPISAYPYGGVGGYPYFAPPSLSVPGMAPWYGGLNPDYGNYWNDPYNTLRPDSAILWSDMWRR